jgi:outer membrane protein assembly factor BamB
METSLPTQWQQDGKNVRKTNLPEWGTSTPAIHDDAVFLTTATKTGLLLLRIDAKSGDVVWTRQVGTGTALRKTPGGSKRTSKFHDLHNLASPSPVTDGQLVFAHFGNGDLACYTLAGEKQWSRNLAREHGAYTIWWGHANSPVLFENLVISVCMQDSLEGDSDQLTPSYLVAHDRQTGDQVWKTMRMTGADAEECDAYTTPVFHRSAGRTTMVVMGGNQLDAYDPASGKPTWTLPGLVGGRTITGPTIAGEMVYATVGMRGPLHAVRLDGQGERSSSEAAAWKQPKNTPDSCCPVVWKGLLFMVTDNGIASCLDTRSGKVQWRNRIAGGNHKASPIAADGRIYFLSRDGHCTVIEAAEEFRKVAENRLDDEFLASPAISDGRIYLRGRSALYTIIR